MFLIGRNLPPRSCLTVVKRTGKQQGLRDEGIKSGGCASSVCTNGHACCAGMLKSVDCSECTFEYVIANCLTLIQISNASTFTYPFKRKRSKQPGARHGSKVIKLHETKLLCLTRKHTRFMILLSRLLATRKGPGIKRLVFPSI